MFNKKGGGGYFLLNFKMEVNVRLYCLVMFISRIPKLRNHQRLSSCEACLFGSTIAFTILSYSVSLYNLLLFFSAVSVDFS